MQSVWTCQPAEAGMPWQELCESGGQITAVQTQTALPAQGGAVVVVVLVVVVWQSQATQ